MATPGERKIVTDVANATVVEKSTFTDSHPATVYQTKTKTTATPATVIDAKTGLAKPGVAISKHTSTHTKDTTLVDKEPTTMYTTTRAVDQHPSTMTTVVDKNGHTMPATILDVKPKEVVHAPDVKVDHRGRPLGGAVLPATDVVSKVEPPGVIDGKKVVVPAHPATTTTVPTTAAAPTILADGHGMATTKPVNGHVPVAQSAGAPVTGVEDIIEGKKKQELGKATHDKSLVKEGKLQEKRGKKIEKAVEKAAKKGL